MGPLVASVPTKPYLALAMKQKWPPKPFSVGNSGLDSVPLQTVGEPLGRFPVPTKGRGKPGGVGAV